MEQVLTQCAELPTNPVLLKYGAQICSFDPGNHHITADLVFDWRRVLWAVADLNGEEFLTPASLVRHAIHHDELELAGKDGAKGRVDAEHTQHELLCPAQHFSPVGGNAQKLACYTKDYTLLP